MLFTVANSHAQTINLDGTDELYSHVRYSSVTGDVTAIGKTRDLRDGWVLLAAMTEYPLNPGEFLFTDPEALYVGMNHHRAVSAADPAMLHWMATYPISYIDFEETDLLPLFEWTPYPTAPDSCQLDVSPTIVKALLSRCPSRC